MNLTTEQLKQVEELAELFFTPGDIALIIEADKDKFCRSCVLHGKIRKAFDKGRLLGEAKIRKSIKELAENGSAPAQQLILKIKQESELRNIIEQNA
jgi:hypothetical protein